MRSYIISKGGIDMWSTLAKKNKSGSIWKNNIYQLFNFDKNNYFKKPRIIGKKY